MWREGHTRGSSSSSSDGMQMVASERGPCRGVKGDTTEHFGRIQQGNAGQEGQEL